MRRYSLPPPAARQQALTSGSLEANALNDKSKPLGT
jgi:hypothetical protein